MVKFGTLVLSVLLALLVVPPAADAAPLAPMTCPASVCTGRQVTYAEQAILLGQDYERTRPRSPRWWAVADDILCNFDWKPPLLKRSSRTPRAGDGVSYAVAIVQGTISTWPGIPRLAVDGRYGSKTSAAVKRWQRTHGHRATGRMDSRTWQHYRTRYCDVG